jgi:hypothetical protein
VSNASGIDFINLRIPTQIAMKLALGRITFVMSRHDLIGSETRANPRPRRGEESAMRGLEWN